MEKLIKVGDKVTLSSTGKQRYPIQQGDSTHGVILDINPNGWHHVSWNKTRANSYKLEDLILYIETPPNKPKFNIDDKVTLSNIGKKRYLGQQGDAPYGTILSKKESGWYRVKWFNKGQDAYETEDLEAYVETIQPNFKIGDAVRLLDSCNSSIYRNQKGSSEYGIINMIDSDGRIHLTWENNYNNNYPPDVFELYSKKDVTFKLGDKVILKPEIHSGWKRESKYGVVSKINNTHYTLTWEGPAKFIEIFLGSSLLLYNEIEQDFKPIFQKGMILENVSEFGSLGTFVSYISKYEIQIFDGINHQNWRTVDVKSINFKMGDRVRINNTIDRLHWIITGTKNNKILVSSELGTNPILLKYLSTYTGEPKYEIGSDPILEKEITEKPIVTVDPIVVIPHTSKKTNIKRSFTIEEI